ncbi:MAG: tetratricopeptide repeat protein [Cystobacter sp.]
MSATWRRWVWVGVVGLVGCRTTGTVGGQGPDSGPRQEVHFDAETVTGSAELAALNDEELFAGGTSAFAARDFAQAVGYFERLVDHHPQSPHRRAALYQAGLAHERLEQWEAAASRFSELADAKSGTGDALEAAFRLAETLYHLERYPDAARLLTTLAGREDLPVGRRLEAQVQQGVCEMETGQPEKAEATLRRALSTYEGLSDKSEVQDYYPAQAYFFIGELYRLRYADVTLDPGKGVDALADDLNDKAELLLSAQGNYLRAIRVGNGHWATAAGTQIGSLYEDLYEKLVNSPAPRELDAEQAEVYHEELRQKVRVLLTKAIDAYEQTLEAAERIGSHNTFVDKTRQSLEKMKALLLRDAEGTPPAPGGARPRS